MNYITNLSATGFTGNYHITSGGYTFDGAIVVDADRNLKSFTGDITSGQNDAIKKVGTFHIYFSEPVSATQDTIMTAIKSVRTSIREDLG